MRRQMILAAAAGLMSIAATATPVAAGDFDFNLGVGHGRHGTQVGVGVGVGSDRHGTQVGVGVGVGHGRDGTGVGVGVNVGSGPRPVPVAPAGIIRPVAAVQRVWVPPVYRIETERVWVPTVETRYRDVPVTDAFGRVIAYRREAFTVAGGYWQEVQRRVLVREGYWVDSMISGSLKRHLGTAAKSPLGGSVAAVRAGFIR